MTTKNLLYASNKLKPRGLDIELATKWLMFNSSKHIQSPRVGVAPNPWNIKEIPAHAMPVFVPYSASFSETTDLRAIALQKQFGDNDLPIVVFWSGGIDSTVALAAMIKNFHTSMLDRVVVQMNEASYFENPVFFDKVIRNKIKYASSSYEYTQYNIVNGKMADPLWVKSEFVELYRNFPEITGKEIQRNPDILINAIAEENCWRTNNLVGKESAIWYYETIIHNAKSAGYDIMDCEDFYWWWNFNFCFSHEKWDLLGYEDITNSTVFNNKIYMEHVISWFDSKEYQLWSMNNRSNGVKIKSTLRSYKMPAKEYIYDLDNNKWYRDYKTKTGSGLVNERNKEVLAVYDNDEIIYA
tara:strand:- start:1340 stop:2404 length:1065 start_codon:yes stop_codon:yes gene_type:complete